MFLFLCSFFFFFLNKCPLLHVFVNVVKNLEQMGLADDSCKPGDSTMVATETIVIGRRLPESKNRYRLVWVFSTPEDKWTNGSIYAKQLPVFTDMLYKPMERIVNGPGFRDMRKMDAKMYLVLSMRSFSRGSPMIPDDCPEKASVKISAGTPLGLVAWMPFTVGHKFYLSEYLKAFMAQLGHKSFQTYQVMDGRRVVPYQCVVVRSQWEEVRTGFREAFRLQKVAYRRGYGGTTSPTLREDVSPRWMPGIIVTCAAQTTVKKTFVELEEAKPQLKRSISTGDVMTCYV